MLQKKHFFSNFNFRTTLFSKIMPNFWRTGAPRIFKIQWFPLSILIFGQQSCFWEPTIFKIPQPNWYYYLLETDRTLKMTSPCALHTLYAPCLTRSLLHMQRNFTSSIIHELNTEPSFVKYCQKIKNISTFTVVIR